LTFRSEIPQRIHPRCIGKFCFRPKERSERRCGQAGVTAEFL
jgi:hypothetical protein